MPKVGRSYFCDIEPEDMEDNTDIADISETSDLLVDGKDE